MSILGKSTGIIVVVVGLVVLFGSGKLFETVESGHWQIKQEAVVGTMTVHSTEGMYLQGFGTIHDYQLTGEFNEPVSVRFKDGSTADINAVVKYRLPVTDTDRLRLHREIQSFANVTNSLVPSAVFGTMKQTANLFGAEEVYSTKRSEFVQMFSEQLSAGLYATKVGKDTNVVIRDENGKPTIAKTSVLKEYNIEIINIEINNIDFDKATDMLIGARKKAEQEETLAQANAEKSKQDAISAEEKGKANVAIAKYEALVLKEQAVIEAEKRTAMSVEATKQAEETAKQNEVKGRAEALKQKLLVEAGLSPLQQAEIDRDKEIGVMAEWAKRPVPEIMIINGTGKGSTGMNPLDVLAYDKLQNMVDSKRVAK